MIKKEINPFHSAQQQFDIAANILKLSDSVKKTLRDPIEILDATLIVKMDNGETKELKAYRSRHTFVRGPAKGGIRFHTNVTLDEVKALSMWMTWKCAVLNLPLSGGKGGVIVDGKNLSLREHEEVARAYIRALGKNFGSNKDVPAPDMYTNPQTMAWMLDEYEKLVGYSDPGMITGKPLSIGGSEGRGTATSLGGFVVLEEAVKVFNVGKKVAIQGLGNVGGEIIPYLNNAGYIIVAVSDSKGGVYSEKGLDLDVVLEHKKKTGSVFQAPNTTAVSSVELLELPVDILIPAAMENQIIGDNAENIKAKLILELANGPVTPDADLILFKKGIHSVPDILANAGGVTVSYFEWVQNKYGYYWSKDEVESKLSVMMKKAFAEVYNMSKDKKVDLRTAAYLLAVKRVSDAVMVRNSK
ncbi:MAG: Glu/Leu/Phe/Val dehydrogenase [Candidatus Woesearchaeota archaeon]|jgi:glutamate dehydrogenase/leucine dehydrogenase